MAKLCKPSSLRQILPILKLSQPSPLCRTTCVKLYRSRSLYSPLLCCSFSHSALLLSRSPVSPSDHLSENDFRKLSDKALVNILEHVDLVFEEMDTQYDLDYSMGVLNINLGEKGSYVLNQQPPNKQIWFSSPISGPMRFEYDSSNNSWFSTKSKACLTEILNTELTSLLGVKINIPK